VCSKCFFFYKTVSVLKLIYVLRLFIQQNEWFELDVRTNCTVVDFRYKISFVYCLPSCTEPNVSSFSQ